MAITKTANPTTTSGLAYFFPATTFTTGTITAQKIPAVVTYGFVSNVIKLSI